VRALLAHGADPTTKNHFGGDALGTAIHGAAHAGHSHGAQIALMIAKALPTKDLSRYIETARKDGAQDVAAVLEHLQNNHDASATRNPGRKADWKPIMDAAFAGDAVRVKKLLDAGADPNIQSTTNHHYRPLHRAIEHKKTMPKHVGHDQVVKLLLEHGADPKRRGTVGNVTALELAAMGEPRFVPLLRKFFEPVDIFHACLLGDPDRVELLLAEKPQLANSKDVNGFAPLHYCAASGIFRQGAREQEAQLRVARALLNAGADPNAAYLYHNEWPISVLYHCCGQQNNPALAKLLMDSGANPCDGEAVYHAADEGHQECLDLFERYVEPKKLAREATRSLPNQLHWGRTRGMAWLLAHGADPNHVSSLYGEASLHAAARNGANEKVIDALLKHGADPRVKNAKGETAIQVAQKAKKTRVVQQLRLALK
jgi:ankyrin repeat protein